MPWTYPFESLTPIINRPPFEFKNATIVLRMVNLKNESLKGNE